jgi:hypothetical protein
MIAASTKIKYEDPNEQEFCRLLVKQCFQNLNISKQNAGLLFASAFDLLITAKYYSTISHKGWFYCPTSEPRLFFHYTNCCPRDALNNKFYFHPSAKPESGRIGAATSRLLLAFFQEIFKEQHRKEEILRGIEPVDAIIIDRVNRKVFFAEIKASPLVTIALSAKSERLTEQSEDKIVLLKHAPVDNISLFKTELEILIPRKEGRTWVERYYPIGRRENANDYSWGYRGFIALLRNNSHFLLEYFEYWSECMKAYYPKSNQSVFWLTNACGAPNDLPTEWPQRRSGEGLETISDTKTSVGMDRTDDIKKGVYQVLKLGSTGKPNVKKWAYKVGLISNIHAARHFNEYLEPIRDIIWTLDKTGKAKLVSDLPSKQAVYNLFDGIVTLTSVISRDEWINSIFNFEA